MLTKYLGLEWKKVLRLFIKFNPDVPNQSNYQINNEMFLHLWKNSIFYYILQIVTLPLQYYVAKKFYFLSNKKFPQ